MGHESSLFLSRVISALTCRKEQVNYRYWRMVLLSCNILTTSHSGASHRAKKHTRGTGADSACKENKAIKPKPKQKHQQQHQGTPIDSALERKMRQAKRQNRRETKKPCASPGKKLRVDHRPNRRANFRRCKFAQLFFVCPK